MLLTPSNFVGELTIGQLASPFVETNLQWFIDKYEPIFYHAVIGEPLYLKMVEGLPDGDELTENKKWHDLKDRTIQYAAAFVWFHYVNNLMTATMGSGEFEIHAESATRKSPWAKMVHVWNEMSDAVKIKGTVLSPMLFWVHSNYAEFVPDLTLYDKYGLGRHENLFGI